MTLDAPPGSYLSASSSLREAESLNKVTEETFTQVRTIPTIPSTIPLQTRTRPRVGQRMNVMKGEYLFLP